LEDEAHMKITETELSDILYTLNL